MVVSFSASSSSPIPPPPAISMPVWSLATSMGSDANSSADTAMNIMTFCTPVSIQPKLWSLALYYDTLTKDSFLRHGKGILQLLTPDQHNPAELIPLLGKKSGRDIDKYQACKDIGVDWYRPGDCEYHVLPHCACYLEVKVMQPEKLVDAGDHVVVICEVTRTGRWKNDRIQWLTNDDGPMEPLDSPRILYTGWLREQGIL